MKVFLLALVFLLQTPGPALQQTPSPEPATEQTQQDQAPPDNQTPALPSQEESVEANETAEQGPADSPSEPDNWPITVSAIFQAIAAFAIAFFTYLLVHYNRGLLRATKQAADAAKKSADNAELAMHISERADLLLDRIGATSGMQYHSAILLDFKNFGRTRAENVTFDFHLEVVGPARKPIPNSPPAVPIGPLVIGAGDVQEISFPRFDHWIDDRTFHMVIKSDISVRIIGQVTYSDVFGHPHRTHLARTYDHHTLAFSIDEKEAD